MLTPLHSCPYLIGSVNLCRVTLGDWNRFKVLLQSPDRPSLPRDHATAGHAVYCPHPVCSCHISRRYLRCQSGKLRGQLAATYLPSALHFLFEGSSSNMPPRVGNHLPGTTDNGQPRWMPFHPGPGSDTLWAEHIFLRCILRQTLNLSDKTHR